MAPLTLVGHASSQIERLHSTLELSGSEQGRVAEKNISLQAEVEELCKKHVLAEGQIADSNQEITVLSRDREALTQQMHELKSSLKICKRQVMKKWKVSSLVSGPSRHIFLT